MAKKKRLLMTYEAFLNSVPEKSREEAVSMYIRNSFQRIFFSSVIFLVISFFSLFYDWRTDFYHRPDEPMNYLNLIGFGFLIVCSVLVLILGFREKKKPFSLRVYQLCHWMYYLVLGLTLAILIFNEFVRGEIVFYEQFYWIFYSAVPLLHLRSNLINVVISAVFYTTEYFVAMQMRELALIDYLYFLPVLISFCLFGLYLRNYYLQTIIYTLQNRELTEQLRSRSRIDPLTGCLNRYVMHERFDALRDATLPLAILMLDIDYFKSYNDGFTHLKGDECLAAVSKCVADICERNGAELFRYGGEEFVIFASGLEENDICELAKDLVLSVRALRFPMPPPLSDSHSYLTISVGAAKVKVGHNSSMKDAIAEADCQLYIAKERGRNCACYRNEKLNIPSD